MAGMKNRLGDVSAACLGGTAGDHQPSYAWICAGGSGLIDARVKSLADDDDKERCVKRVMKASTGTSEDTDAYRSRQTRTERKGERPNEVCYWYGLSVLCSCTFVRYHIRV